MANKSTYITIRVDEEMLNDIDTFRVDVSRSLWCRRVLERGIQGARLRAEGKEAAGSSDGPSRPLPGAGRAARSNPK